MFLKHFVLVFCVFLIGCYGEMTVTFEQNDETHPSDTEQVDGQYTYSGQSEPMVEYTPYSNQVRSSRGDIPSESPCDEEEARAVDVYKTCGNRCGSRPNCPLKVDPQPTTPRTTTPQPTIPQPTYRPCSQSCRPHFPTISPIKICPNDCTPGGNIHWPFPPSPMFDKLKNPDAEIFEPLPLPQVQQPLFIYYPNPQPFPDFPTLPPLPPLQPFPEPVFHGPTFGGIILAPGFGFGNSGALTDCSSKCNNLNPPINGQPCDCHGNEQPCN